MSELTLDAAIDHAQAMAECRPGTQCGDEHRQLAEWLRELRHRRKMEALKRRDEDYGDETALHMLGVRSVLLDDARFALDQIRAIAEEAYDVPERDREGAYDHALTGILELAKKPLKTNDGKKGDER